MSSRFTIKALKKERVCLISKYDPAIDWDAMNSKGIFFDEDSAALAQQEFKKRGDENGSAVPGKFDEYDIGVHSLQVVCLADQQPIKFFCHFPTMKEKLTSYDMSGIEVDQESGAKYVGARGGAADYRPGNGVAVGMTSAFGLLAQLCIDDVRDVECNPGSLMKETNGYGLQQLSKDVIAAISPLDDDGHPVVDALDVVFTEIGSFLHDGPPSGNSGKG